MSTLPQNYYEAKGYLWLKFMGAVKPGWQDYQRKAIALATKLHDDPKKKIDNIAIELLKIVFEYRDEALKNYGKYILSLCTSFAMHSMRNEGINPATLDTLVKYYESLVARMEKKGGKHGVGRKGGK